MTEQEMRALDERIGRHMGGPEAHPEWWWFNGTAPTSIPILWAGPRFSSDGAAMLALMEWLRANGCEFDLGTQNPREDGYWAEVYPISVAVEHHYRAATAPLALALAADAALAGEEGR